LVVTGQLDTDVIWTLNTRNWEVMARKGQPVSTLLHLWSLINACCVEEEVWGKMDCCVRMILVFLLHFLAHSWSSFAGFPCS